MAEQIPARSARLIDGLAVARQLRQRLAREVAALRAIGTVPGLAVILVGDDAASQVYVRNKVKACQELGMHSVLERYDSDLSEAALLDRIRSLNHDASIHGILVQLPLPAHMNSQRVIETISANKDVDGFHVHSAGALMVGQSGFWPCTPYGCIKLLESLLPSGAALDLTGQHAVVIGRSNIVGKPMAMMLLRYNATVTICHSGTRDLAALTRTADIVVAAVGKRGLVRADMIKPGAVVLDVGMNRDDNGKLCGDVDFTAVSQVASAITPVPGGVGPMTITMLMANTLAAAQASRSPDQENRL